MTTVDQPFDLVSTDETRLQKLLDDLYDYGGNVCTKLHHSARIALFRNILRKLIDDDAITNLDRALDIGCNAGFYSKLISDFGFHEVTGIDIDSRYIATAKATFASDTPGKRIAFKTADATKMDVDANYDLILCTEVIEHTDDPKAVIERITSLLAPGGVAVVSLPNCLSLGFGTAYLGALLRRRISKDLSDHVKYPFYRGPSLFRQSGFTVIYSAGANCLFNDRLLSLLYGGPLFSALNRVNFWLSTRWPFKMLAQFFFFVVRAKP